LECKRSQQFLVYANGQFKGFAVPVTDSRAARNATDPTNGERFATMEVNIMKESTWVS